MEKKSRWSRFRERLKNKYRFVVINDDTFEEHFSLRLSPLGIVVLFSSISIVMIFLVISTIAFTPLREYIPGYGSDASLKQNLISLNQHLDSLDRKLYEDSLYIRNLNAIISGQDSGAVNPQPSSVKSGNYNNLQTNPSRNDSLFRNAVESQDPYSLFSNPGSTQKNSISGFFFFTPVKGLVTASFNSQEDHFGVDIAAKENEAIKSTLDGTVVFSGWTVESGHVIQVQHENNLVSVYKHNSVLLKKSGEYVKSGEAIAIIGNSGEHTTGPHLHFELWYNGKPIDPQQHMVF